MEAQRPSVGTNHIETLRRWIFVVIVLGLLGTITELIFLEHYEEPLQFVPLVLIVTALVLLVWHALRHDETSLRGLQIVMALFVLAGFVGVVAHFHGSAEFQVDLNPEIGTWELLEKVLRAKAPPLLAPGMMLQLGLLGLAYVYSDARYRVRALRVLGFSLQKE